MRVQPNSPTATALTNGNSVLHYIFMWFFFVILRGMFFSAYKLEQPIWSGAYLLSSCFRVSCYWDVLLAEAVVNYETGVDSYMKVGF
jgi:hypothetical protein